MSGRGLGSESSSYSSSYSSSSYSSSSYSSSYAYADDDPCGHRRRLAVGGDCPPLGVFDFAFVSSSDYVVYSFIIVVAFTIAAEIVLEHLEEEVSAVYHKVLQKLYKELMLLGLISFGLFIANTSIHDLDASHTHSFEYAHFVMLFVGVLQCLQTSWACYCNLEIKKHVWIACNGQWNQALKESYEKHRNDLLWCFSETYHYITLDLFKICFHEVFDLPRDFSFAHYFAMSLDSHTVELVDVLPSSYACVLALVVLSEFVVRFQGPSEHSLGWWSVDGDTSVLVFFALGLALSAAYVWLYLSTAKALANVLAVKFGCESHRTVGRSLEIRLMAASDSNSSGNGNSAPRSLHQRRGLEDVLAEMRPFMDKSYFEGIEKVEKFQSVVHSSSSSSSQDDGSSSVAPLAGLSPPPPLRSASSSSVSPSSSSPPRTQSPSVLLPSLQQQQPKNKVAPEPMLRLSSVASASSSSGAEPRNSVANSLEEGGGGGGGGGGGSLGGSAVNQKPGVTFHSEVQTFGGPQRDSLLLWPLKSSSSSSSSPSSSTAAAAAAAEEESSLKSVKSRRASVATKAFLVSSTSSLGSSAVGGRRRVSTVWPQQQQQQQQTEGEIGGGGGGGGGSGLYRRKPSFGFAAVVDSLMKSSSSSSSFSAGGGTREGNDDDDPSSSSSPSQSPAAVRRWEELKGWSWRNSLGGSHDLTTTLSSSLQTNATTADGTAASSSSSPSHEEAALSSSASSGDDMEAGGGGGGGGLFGPSAVAGAQKKKQQQQQQLQHSSSSSSSASASKSKKPSHKKKQHNQTATSRLVGHAGAHSPKAKRNTVVLNKLETSHLEADAIVECIREALPLASLDFLRRALDAVRFLAAFFLSVYVTTFMPILWTEPEEFAMHLSGYARLLAACSFAPLLLAFVLLEPIVLFQYAMISTVSCVNPLLLGETLEFVSEQRKMMEFLAFRVLHRYMTLTDLNVAASHENLTDMRDVLLATFEDWDLHQVGYIDKATFVHVMHSLGLHFTTSQMGALFRRIDPDLSGHITFDEFWAALESPLQGAMSMLHSNFAPLPMDSPAMMNSVGGAGGGGEEGEDSRVHRFSSGASPNLSQDAVKEEEEEEEGEGGEESKQGSDGGGGGGAAAAGGDGGGAAGGASAAASGPPLPVEAAAPSPAPSPAPAAATTPSPQGTKNEGEFPPASSPAPMAPAPMARVPSVATKMFKPKVRTDDSVEDMDDDSSANGVRTPTNTSTLSPIRSSPTLAPLNNSGGTSRVRAAIHTPPALPPIRPGSRGSGGDSGSGGGGGGGGGGAPPAQQRRQTLSLSGSGQVLQAVGAFATVEDFFYHMTPSAPGGGGGGDFGP